MIPNRANYGGETRRTSKIHWQKGRSTVTGQPGPEGERRRFSACPVRPKAARSGAGDVGFAM